VAPSIAVVITCYNKSPYVECALHAVLSQVHRADDVVFVDDGSTDDSVAIAERFAAAHPALRLRILQQPNSGQPAFARNAGIATVTADLVVCLDADDSLSPLYLAAVVEAFQRDPGIGLAYPSGIGFGDGALRPIGSQDWDPERLAHTNYLLCVTAFRREIWEQVGGYRTNVRGYEDWDFWLAASALGYRGAWIPLQLFHYRELIADGAFAATAGKDLVLRSTIVRNNPSVYDEGTRRLARALCDDAPIDILALWRDAHEMLRVALLTEARRVSRDAMQWAADRVQAGGLASELQRLQALVQARRMDVEATRQLGALLLQAGEVSQGNSLLLTAWVTERDARLQAAATRVDERVVTSVAPEGRPPRVLCYMPYGRWNVHALQEMTILHAARLRGAEVRYVLCDGVFRECDMHWGVVLPRTANSCAVCIAGQHQQADNMKFPHEWLGGFITASEREMASEWAASLPAASLLSATWQEWTLGAWVVSSVHSHFRANEVNTADAEHERVMRAYLEAGLLTAFAVSRLLREWQPDVLLQFNGRQATTRVALELARAAGVRVVTHERGWLTETMYLAEDADCLALRPIRDAWARWRHVPLTAAECDRVAQWLSDRAQGRNLSWVAFTTAPGSVEIVRTRLGLRGEAPCLVAFTSSEDEYIASSEYTGVFGTQLAWLEHTVAWARENGDVDLVIRIHPNTGGKLATGRNAAQLAWLERLALDLPDNVRMVWPEDDISSYSLMELAAGALSYVSIVSLEAACRGHASFMAANAATSSHGFTDDFTTVAEYPALLRRYADGESADAARARRTLAYRFAFMMLHRYMAPFPLVEMPTFSTSRLGYATLDALLPGRDAALDRVVSVLLDGTRVCADPPSDVSLDADGETAWHAARPVPVREPCGR
jgi:glycosyltransferase involved in cell wall biosynthesis